MTTKDKDALFSIFEEKDEIDEMVCVIKVQLKSCDGAVEANDLLMVFFRGS